MALDLKTAFGQWAESIKIPFNGDRGATVGASEIGKCARKVAAEKALARLGQNVPQQPLNGAAVRGDIMEDHVTVRLLQYAIKKQLPGAKLLWAGQQEQRRFQSLTWKMSATLDGLIVDAPRDALSAYGVSDIGCDCFVVEGKSFDPRKDSGKFPEAAHVEQAIQQMGLLRAEGNYTPNWAIIVYINASFYDDIKVCPVRFTSMAFENLKRRAITIMGANDPLTVRPEGKIAGGKECETCWMVDQCGGYAECVPQSSKNFEHLPRGLQVQLMSQIGTLDNVSRQITDLESREATAKATIKELLTAANTKTAKGALKDGRSFEIRWSKLKPKTSTDMEGVSEALRVSGYDIEDFRKEGKAGGESLTVKVKERENNQREKENA